MAHITLALMARFVDVRRSEQLGERAVEIARQLGDDRLLTQSLAILCAACSFAGDFERGLPFGQESVDRARVLGDDFLLAESLNAYLLCNQVTDPDRTEQLCREAIACIERCSNPFLTGVLQNNAGCLALAMGNVPVARARFEASVRAMRSIGQQHHHAAIGLGWVRRGEDDREGSRSMFEEALRMSRRTGDRPGAAYASLGLACLAGDLGEWQRAGVLHGVAQGFFDITGEPWQVPEVGYRQASINQVRARLGEDEFGHSYATGKALSFEQAIDLAFGGKVPHRDGS